MALGRTHTAAELSHKRHEAKRLKEMGYTANKIARMLGVSNMLVYEFLKLPPTPRLGPMRREVRIELRKRAKELYNQGYSYTYIARELEIPLGSVTNMLSGSTSPNIGGDPNVKRLRPRAAELVNQGLCDVEVARMLNIHKTTVGRWRRESEKSKLQTA